MTTRHTPPAPINRTGHAITRRALGGEGDRTDTVASGPSASENAEGAGTLPTPDAFSRYARVTASSDATGRLVTAMPESTSRDPARTTGTPRSQDPNAVSRAEIEQEARDLAAFEAAVRDLAALAAPFWRWGDGSGGYVRHQIEQALTRQGLIEPRRAEPKPYTKAPIPAALRRQVFERDAYRCQHCRSWRDLHADHIHPESKGGPTTLDNLQTLCGPCNISKGARV